jgi:hypothetical protein
MNMFWIVLADKHVLQATYRHPSKESAMTEAGRLATQHGGRFLVAEVVGAAERVAVQWTDAQPAQPPAQPLRHACDYGPIRRGSTISSTDGLNPDGGTDNDDRF